MKKFILRVWYGTGNSTMLVDTPDFRKALDLFLKAYTKCIPDTKEYGLPDIIKAELTPLMYDSVYEEETKEKE